jgi:hypothetical protein
MGSSEQEMTCLFVLWYWGWNSGLHTGQASIPSFEQFPRPWKRLDLAQALKGPLWLPR